ncbi:lysophospholipase L1-like esterase [Crossiella equi]|uniref:Lysophospholipase L1-like esterase n=1 Tax=Crossiella equi TaxID=130796 RepID=A0ABS5AH33_9PSEU|nr:SGNH/GDSL hydrolase family protein [Crossiella equi]MBP2475592.1 lysophospholipase L1-like esterase [Crossiella equi]
MALHGKRSLAALVTLALLATGSPASAAPTGWVGTWASSPSAAVPGSDRGYANHSMRNTVHTSIGGSQVRVRLSNAFSDKPVLFGKVTVAVAAGPGTPRAVPGTMRVLTFGGETSVTAPARADLVSDAAELAVPADGDLLVTTFTPEPSGPVTHHSMAMQHNWFSRDGDHAAEESGAAFTEQTPSWHYVTAVDVRGKARASVVALGDSITDGWNAGYDTNLRWPDQLADRLGGRLGVLNAGISGNRVLLDAGQQGQSALARFDRDVLAQAGVRTVIVFEGINDITNEPRQADPRKIIEGLKQVASRAKARGLRVLAGTIAPFKNTWGWTEQLDGVRQEVNRFIRNNPHFDGLVDFDVALRDTEDPLRLRPAYNSGDNLHPNAAGFTAMAAAVDLARL